MGSSNADRGGSVLLPLTDPAWISFVEGHPEATPFHHPAWANVLARSYRFESCGLALVAADGESEAAVPLIRLGGRASRRRGVSLPFTDRCPPLLAPGADRERLGDRLERARHGTGVGSLEVRDELPGGAGYAQAQGYRHVLALGPDVDEQFANVAKTTRYMVRKAERKGVEVRRSNSGADLLEVFYRQHITTRRRLGVPVQPRRFFEVLARDYIEPGLGFVVIASLGDTPVASAVFLAWNRRIEYKYSASDRSHGDVGAGQAVVWDAIRWGCQNGHLELDFGRTERGHEGLRRFKRAWGGVERDLTYTLLADTPPRPRSGRALRILEPVIRKSPEVVSRAIGWAGYRYTA